MSTLNKKKGFLVGIEGPEGAGKTTLAQLLSREIAGRGHPTLVTREPGGAKGEAPFTGRFRDLMLSSDAKKFLSPTGELLGMLAAREAHWNELVKPALDEGRVVICDRLWGSTFAYQLRGRKPQFGGRISEAEQLFEVASDLFEIHPDFYVWLDVTPEIGLERRRGDTPGSLTHFDLEEIDFHRRVCDGFREFFASGAVPHTRVNAALPIEDVAEISARAVLEAIAVRELLVVEEQSELALA